MRQTTPRQEGAALVVKEMKGTDNTAFPKHTASRESVLVLLDGAATITLQDAVHELRPGDTFIVPAGVVHQIVGTPDFTAIHVMPKDIHFNFKA